MCVAAKSAGIQLIHGLTTCIEMGGLVHNTIYLSMDDSWSVKVYTDHLLTVFLCRFQGWESLLEYASREWSSDIMGRQLPLILKGVGPTHYITQFGESVALAV